MRDLYKVMKWEEAESYFIENILPGIRETERLHGREHASIDGPMRREREVPLYRTTPGTRALY